LNCGQGSTKRKGDENHNWSNISQDKERKCGTSSVEAYNKETTKERDKHVSLLIIEKASTEPDEGKKKKARTAQKKGGWKDCSRFKATQVQSVVESKKTESS